MRPLAGAALGLVIGCGPIGGAPSPSNPVLAGYCPVDSVCFNVFSGAPGSLGPARLVIMWVRPDHEHDASPDITELASLSGQEHAVVIQRSRIRPPARVGAFGVTWGYVFVLPPNATSAKQSVGVAQMMFTDAQPVALQFPLRDKYPAGIAPGIAPYRMSNGGAGHDKFYLAPPGAVFDLVICPVVAPNCPLPSPNPN